ncbi:MAG: phenylalanine--tRNA ligase subunit beta, partial [Deltaproteobacteria bacterium]|nr:phenylalanine--tRNA ligase subunit beta [Deltaproteobacteria bacterium]
DPFLHPGASARVVHAGQAIGSLGEVHPETASRFGIGPPVAVFSLDLTSLVKVRTQRLEIREISRQPAVRRDLAVLLDRAQPAGDVLDAIRKQGGAALAEARLFDRYEGQGVPEGKVGLGFRLVFQRSDRTLTDAEVTKMTDRVSRMLVHRFGAERR